MLQRAMLQRAMLQRAMLQRAMLLRGSNVAESNVAKSYVEESNVESVESVTHASFAPEGRLKGRFKPSIGHETRNEQLGHEALPGTERRHIPTACSTDINAPYVYVYRIFCAQSNQ